MLLDQENLFSDAQVVTTGSDTGVASSNVIDFGIARDVGVGENLFLIVSIDTDMADTGSNSALTVYAQSDDNEAFNSASNTQTIGTFAAVSPAGSAMIARIQPGTFNERFGRLFYQSSNGALSGGAFTAAIVKDVQKYTSYPTNVVIS